MSRGRNALIFIPDISGFTQFVNQTELDHSSHIIAELIELILQSNPLSLEVCEIEGDAVLYYKLDEIPSPASLEKQALKTFQRFHEHLMIYERDRICQCGACTTAGDLSLKFVAHFGEVTIQEYQGRKKLFGTPVNLAHRLLKAGLDSNEYLLYSQDYLNQFPNSEKYNYLNKEFPELGRQNFHVKDLKEYKEALPKPAQRETFIPKVEKPIHLEVDISRNYKEVHNILIDLSKRHIWGTKVKINKEEIERVGTTHYCVIPQGNLLAEVLDFEEEKDQIRYVEFNHALGLLIPETTVIYNLKSKGKNNCLLVSELHPKGNFLFKLLFRKAMKRISLKSLYRLKDYCEAQGAP